MNFRVQVCPKDAFQAFFALKASLRAFLMPEGAQKRHSVY
jgi:hypothetical protein